MNLRRRAETRAFSVLELLVATAIITILGVLSFKYSSALQQQSQASRCVANLRQIGLFTFAYAADHQQQLPLVLNTARTPPDKIAWMHKLLPYTGYDSKSMGSPPLPRATGVFYCPSMTEAERNDRLVGYFYNSQIAARRSYLLSRITQQPTYLFVEGVPKNVESIGPGGLAFRHRGTTNVLFTQGHIATLTAPVANDAPEWGAYLLEN